MNKKSGREQHFFLSELLEQRTLFSSFTLAPLAAMFEPAPSSSLVTGGTSVVQDSSGNSYFVQYDGGAAQAGEIFEYSPTTKTLSPLASFDGTSGVQPVALAIDLQGNLFGITHFLDYFGGVVGSTAGSGVLFELPVANRSVIQTVYTFNDTTIGQFPSAMVMDSSDNIYVLTSYAAANNDGSIVKFDAATHTPSLLGSLTTPYQDDANSLTLSNGTFYGTTFAGGDNGAGTIFKLPAGSSTVQTIASFSSTVTGGGPESAPIVEADGTLYGTVPSAGGSVYKFDPTTNLLSEAAAFNDMTLGPPQGPLSVDSNGNILGTSSSSTKGTGAIFEFTPSTGALSAVGYLDSTEGTAPANGVAIEADGNLLGVTYSGGANNAGALFEATPGGGGVSTSGGTLTPALAKNALPASAVAGQVSHATELVSLTNSSASDEKGPISVTLYASGDGAIDSNSVAVGSYAGTVFIRAGKTGIVKVHVTSIPAGLDGSYTLLPSVTDTTGGVSTATTGPTLAAAPPFIQYASLVVSDTLLPSVVSGQKSKAVLTLKLTNDGNIISTGTTTFALYVSPDGTIANGTLIRTYSKSVPLKPLASTTTKIPLLSLPSVPNGSYVVVTQITDPKNNQSSVYQNVKYALATPFMSLTPTAPVVVVAKSGTATLSFTVTNNGNIASTGLSSVVLFASTDGTAANAESVLTVPIKIALTPTRSHTEKVKLTATQFASLQAAPSVLLQVTDSLGDSQVVALTV